MDDIERDGMPKAWSAYGMPSFVADERPGEIRNLMDDDVRLPGLGDLPEVVGPWPERDSTYSSVKMNGRICAGGSESTSGNFRLSSSRASTPSPA